MKRIERLHALLRLLVPEQTPPRTEAESWRQFRALVNVRPPSPVSAEFLRQQDALLAELLAERGAVDAAALAAAPLDTRLCLWQGDITRLKADAIVNAANSRLLGCFAPGHLCVDNAIHTFAGVQLRLACDALMRAQGAPEKTGGVKITPAYNLPSRYVLHTVGPIVAAAPTDADCRLLALCYRSCLDLAAQHGLASVAFCCVSTGAFRFPNETAARIAIESTRRFLDERPGTVARVVFNVFEDVDAVIYRHLLYET